MTNEDILDHGKMYIGKSQFVKAAKVFRNGKDFEKKSEMDYYRKTLLAYCLFQLDEIDEALAIAKKAKPKEEPYKEMASVLICSSHLKLECYEQAFITMKSYLQDNTPNLYLRTLQILIIRITEGVITNESMITEINEWAEKYKVSS